MPKNPPSYLEEKATPPPFPPRQPLQKKAKHSSTPKLTVETLWSLFDMAQKSLEVIEFFKESANTLYNDDLDDQTKAEVHGFVQTCDGFLNDFGSDSELCHAETKLKARVLSSYYAIT